MGMAAPIYYTADMVRALPDDGNRYETARPHRGKPCADENGEQSLSGFHLATVL